MVDTKELFNNRLEVTGTVIQEPYYTHSVHTSKAKVRYYRFVLSCERFSGVHDVMEVSIKEELMQGIDFTKPLHIIGEIRTANVGMQLKVYVFVNEIQNYKGGLNINYFEATVYTCKKPNFRTTPGGKQITDLTLACIRSYKNRSDYFPTIAWGRQAVEAGNLTVGKKLYITARMQSRNYTKMIEGVAIEKTAYEVSLTNFEVLE